MQTKVMNLYIDHEKFGCGYRDYVAMEGRVWVRLVEIATGDTAKIGKRDFEEAAKRGRTYDKPAEIAKARKRLRRNAKVFGRDTTAVKDALAALGGAA